MLILTLINMEPNYNILSKDSRQLRESGLPTVERLQVGGTKNQPFIFLLDSHGKFRLVPEVIYCVMFFSDKCKQFCAKSER